MPTYRVDISMPFIYCVKADNKKDAEKAAHDLAIAELRDGDESCYWLVTKSIKSQTKPQFDVRVDVSTKKTAHKGV